MRPPRNVVNYHVQEAPDSCQNCRKRYLGMVSEVGSIPYLACSLACSDPKKPCWCDRVDPLGICDAFERGQPDEHQAETKFRKSKVVLSESGGLAMSKHTAAGILISDH